MIEQGNKHLMIKISSPIDISFYDEHIDILKKEGYVWFCRFGKDNLKIDEIGNDGKYIFIKESKANGGKCYLAEYECLQRNIPVSGYPKYYDGIQKERNLWIKVISLKILPEGFEASFRASSSGGELSSIYRSMCNAFYITAQEKYET